MVRAGDALAAFSRGYDAFRAGVPLVECPYPRGSDMRAEWHRGWIMASNRAVRSGQAALAAKGGGI